MRGAQQHKTVLLNEAIEALALEQNSVVVDGTFGRGGHSKLILQRLGVGGHLIALDKDPDAIAYASNIKDTRFQIVHSSFAHLEEVLGSLQIDQINAVLLDLGVSSPQLECAERGFSFRRDAPLDMRMNTSSGQTASEWLEKATEQELKEVLTCYGEERFAKQIAKAVVIARARQPIATTTQLAKIVAGAIPTHEKSQDPATRTFQAIRIFINQELTELSYALPQCMNVLKRGGRLVVISFHSLEDRIVKRFMRDAAQPVKVPARLPIPHAQLPKPLWRVVGKPIRPSEKEIAENPRARSAVMRVAEKL